MSPSSAHDTDVLIAGAGPTGLVLALWLARLGIRVRIIDKTAGPGTTSRAVAVQARTLEFYRQIGLADAVVARGRRAVAVNLWVAGKQVAHVAFGNMGAGISRYPYALLFPQDEHEQLLIDRLAAVGVAVERQTELLGFEDAADGVRARIQGPDAAPRTVSAAYIAGCDGAHSTVRETLRIGFPGGTYAHLFYVADADGRGPAMNGEVHVALDRTDFLAVFPLAGEGRARLVGAVRNDAQTESASLSWNDVSKRVMEWMRIGVDRVNWFSTYRVHHRVADHFRAGRAFLLGDAAHIHSPVGGQGMNTGIGDAVNLAWKLAAVVRDRATPSLLDSYEPERMAFARRLVATTDRAFTYVTSPNALARFVRLHLIPILLPPFFGVAAVRRFLFRAVSQTAVNYRGSTLSVGRAGPVHGGDRLPWAQLDQNTGDADNFTPLATLDWQVHVYGDASPEIRSICEQRQLPLHVFPWRPRMERAGLRHDAVYLVRPDGYVAVADAAGHAAAVASYLDRRTIAPNR